MHWIRARWRHTIAGVIDRTRLAVMVGIPIAALGALSIAWHKRPAAPPPPIAIDAAEPLDEGEIVPWCAGGLEPIRGGGCFAPAGTSDEAPTLIVYFHGMYDSATTGEELDRQRRVAKMANRRGFALLALRGTIGECKTRPDRADWYCWPSNEHTAEDAPSFVASWGPVLRAVDQRVGHKGKRYLFGFSNGAFFAGLLAVRALFAADAVVVAHGGSVEPVRALSVMPPILLLSADDDIVTTDWMMRFDRELAREAWPHDTYARASGGHALTDDDIDAAITFLERSAHERMPLTPPLRGHRPQAKGREASVAPSDPPIDASTANLDDGAPTE